MEKLSQTSFDQNRPLAPTEKQPQVDVELAMLRIAVEKLRTWLSRFSPNVAKNSSLINEPALDVEEIGGTTIVSVSQQARNAKIEAAMQAINTAALPLNK